MLYPLLLKPTYHIKVWGGRKLETELQKTLPSGEPYGESWELHDTSVVANGAFKGETLGNLLSRFGAELIGAHNDVTQGFPLLAKFLDAQDWLSVQVHPNDEQARVLENEPRGKTEAWIVLNSDPDAKLVMGVKPGTTRDQVAAAIRHNTLEDLLIYVKVKDGDALYMRAGTIHALGPGCLIYEIQQSSDLTYRLYDWGRMDLNGKPRQLHIEKGVQVSNVETLPEVTHPTDLSKPIVAGEYFTTYRDEVDGERSHDTGGRIFHALTCIDGSVEIIAGDHHVTLKMGQTVLIPSSLGAYTMQGKGSVLRSMQNV